MKVYEICFSPTGGTKKAVVLFLRRCDIAGFFPERYSVSFYAVIPLCLQSFDVFVLPDLCAGFPAVFFQILYGKKITEHAHIQRLSKAVWPCK